MRKLLIQNGRIWDGERFYFSDILTEGTRIIEIQEHISQPADFVYDATGKTVTPGLIDLHVHMKGIASENFGIEPNMSSFPFGVTAVNDAGSAHGDRALLDSFAVKNTVFVCVEIRDNHADFALTEKLLQVYGNKAIGIKVYFDTAISQVRDITPLQEICAYAASKGLKVMVHCTNSPVSMTEIVNTLSPGDILTHIYHGGENTCTGNTFEAFKIAQEKGVVLDAGFAGHVHTDLAILKKAFAGGFFPHTISTDITRYSAYMRGGRYGMTMCMNMAHTAGMEEADIFKAVTSTPAKVLGKAAEWGYLQVGRCADLAVLEDTDEGFDLTDRTGNRLHSNTGYRCILTVSDGVVLYRH